MAGAVLRLYALGLYTLAAKGSAARLGTSVGIAGVTKARSIPNQNT